MQVGERSVPVILSPRDLIFIVAATLMLIVLNYIVNVTKLGKAIRATAQDMPTASLMGIDVNRIIALTFLIGGALGGAAGALFGLRIGTVNPYMGLIPGLKAFTAAVLGGIGNITGAMVGGIVLGFLEAFVAAYLSIFTSGNFSGAAYADIAAFSILILLLIFRPSGLLGEATTQKV
jgi:branched-chain amino acid transport system permease protein